MQKSPFILEVKDLKKHFPIRGGLFFRRKGTVFAVDGVSFSLRRGETLGLVGESGCGKTTVGRCITWLYKPTSGTITYDGIDMAAIHGAGLRKIRKEVQMVFQDPFESLNPRHTVGHILEEPFIIHRIGNAQQRRRAVSRLMDRVGLPGSAMDRFPHEFSGGQRQRIGIARAIALSPKLLICDEPVSALDVSIQSQILNLLLDLQRESGFTCLFIAHDLAVVRHVSDWIAVMYLGQIVEYTDADTIYKAPLHPYTKALISAIPIPDPTAATHRQVLSGDLPSPSDPPQGCRFHTRCPFKVKMCEKTAPSLQPADTASSAPVHQVACHRAAELAQRQDKQPAAAKHLFT